MAIIKIGNGPVLTCEPGSILLEVLHRNEILVENPCNGKGTCGKCRVKVLFGEVSPMTETERKHLKPEEIAAGYRLSCMTAVLGDCEIELLHRETKHTVLTGGYVPAFEKDDLTGYGVAVDIGTTTVALSLVELENGRELAHASAINPQKQYGLDVLTRITYEYEKGETAIAQLQKTIVDSLNVLLDQLCRDAGIGKEEIAEIVVAANCCMTHMLLGVDARSMGRAPYAPEFLEVRECLATEIGLWVGKSTRLYCLPQVSAYIGGDIVAGAEVCQLEKEQGNVLFIDIGTNGEIVLAADGKLLSCSCAAGPALEGMNISCGMRAAEGAVEDVHIRDEGVILETIGSVPPEGLCGSGILAAVRELVKGGYVKKTGAFVQLAAQPKPEILRLSGTKREAVLCREPEIIVTQDDVRQVQLAKGAILSGFLVLLEKAGITMEQLDKVLIAGQFGAHLPAESLVGIGLLPSAVRNKLQYVGNSAKTGAYMALLSREKRHSMEALAKKIGYIELAQTKDYDRIFAASMAFPK